tara:strand:- start:102 stop:413 length:312 start_codon:yes stop_codon:yes gene_type:complete
MANSPQAKYRAEKSQRVRERKSKQMSALRTCIKKLRTLVQSGADKDALMSAFSKTCSHLDKSATKGLIPTNRAKRLKSRLNQHIKDNLVKQSAPKKKAKKSKS